MRIDHRLVLMSELQGQKPPSCGHFPLMLSRKRVIRFMPPLWLLRQPEYGPTVQPHLSNIRYTRSTDERTLINRRFTRASFMIDSMQHSKAAVDYSAIRLVYTDVKLPGCREKWSIFQNVNNLFIENDLVMG